MDATREYSVQFRTPTPVPCSGGSGGGGGLDLFSGFGGIILHILKTRNMGDKISFPHSFTTNGEKMGENAGHRVGRVGEFCVPVHRAQKIWGVLLAPKFVVPHCSQLV